jgi:hypothetical protein
MIRDAHDIEPATAMLEKLPDRRTQAGTRPGTPETALKIAEGRYENWSIEGATKSTANKSCRGFWRHIDGLIHRCDFGDRDATINCI